MVVCIDSKKHGISVPYIPCPWQGECSTDRLGQGLYKSSGKACVKPPHTYDHKNRCTSSVSRRSRRLWALWGNLQGMALASVSKSTCARARARGQYRPGSGPGRSRGPPRRMCVHARALPECPQAGGKRDYRLGPRGTPISPNFFDFTMWPGPARRVPPGIRNQGPYGRLGPLRQVPPV